jgi:hypothetical protein
VELLAENPYWTTRRAAERLKVAFTTAQRAVVKLEALGIMRQVTEAKRDRVYCATPLLKILEEPARLVKGRRDVTRGSTVGRPVSNWRLSSSKSSIPRRGQASAAAASYPSSGSPDRGVLRTIESNRFVTEVTWIDGEL